MRTELGRSQVEVQQCALSSEVGEELGEELARRKWRWKLMQTWSRRNWRRRRRRRRTTALIKSNNLHLAGGEKDSLPTSSAHCRCPYRPNREASSIAHPPAMCPALHHVSHSPLLQSQAPDVPFNTLPRVCGLYMQGEIG